MIDGNKNAVWAAAFMDELARAGIREVCLAPGSRSTPLVMGAVAEGRLRIWTLLDERSAGFFAVGLGRASGRPAAVITTSGTAAANLFPAVIEAFQSEVPLLVLTADRPHRLRGADANQSVDQLRLYGGHVRAFFESAPPTVTGPALHHLRSLACRAVGESLGLPAGPVHVNFPFAKPLEPVEVPGDVPAGFEDSFPEAASGRSGGRPFVRVTPRRPAVSRDEVVRIAALLQNAKRPLLVAGPSGDPERTGAAMLRVARATGAPLVADPLSGSRFRDPDGTAVMGAYDLFLRSERARTALEPDLVVRTGVTPTSATLAAFLDGHPGPHHVVIDPGFRWKDYMAVAHAYVRGDPAEFLAAVHAELSPRPESSYTHAWREVEAVTRAAVIRGLGLGFFEGTAVHEVSRTAPDGAVLFVSNSMPIRDLDSYAPPRAGNVRILANRGASGIDGIVSSATGVAVAAATPTLAVLGDLAFYHDMNGLLAARDAGADIVFVVINNDGGGIFHMLPIRDFEPAFTKHFATPHGLDFRHAAELYGLPYARVDDRPSLTNALQDALAGGGTRIVEVRADRVESARRREEIQAAVLLALERMDLAGADRQGKKAPPESMHGDPE